MACCVGISVASMLFSQLHLTTAVIFLCISVAVWHSVSLIRAKGQFVSLSLVFWAFSCLYGLAGPITVWLGGSLPYKNFNDSVVGYINDFLFAYSLSNLGFLVGCCFIYKRKEVESCKPVDQFELNKTFDTQLLEKGALISAALASFSEMVNLFRVGGFPMLFVGKGPYQSAVGDLVLTLPSDEFCQICAIFLGLLLASEHLKGKQLLTRKIAICVTLAFPYLFVKIILGQRGPLLTIIIIGVACFTAVFPMQKIAPQFIVGTGIFYIIMAFLYANRSMVKFLLSDPQRFFKTLLRMDRFLNALIPSNNEFGAPFGNFCIFFQKYGTTFQLRMGSTYITGLATFIPSILYPGTKPTQIVYAFRDEFFPQLVETSRISSTGFSSILEAYINFGFLGVFITYLLIGLIVAKQDTQKLLGHSLWRTALYGIGFAAWYSFSRRTLSGVLQQYIFLMGYFVCAWLLAHIKMRKFDMGKA